MFLALFSLYPLLVACIGFLTAGILVVSTSINVVLTTLCLALYMMIPVGSFDHWFSSAKQLIQMLFPIGVEKLCNNIAKTFQYHEASPPERALYLWHPHGLFSLTPFIHTFLQKRSKVACLPFFHRIPIVRDLYHYVGAIPSDYETMKATLEEQSLSVIPGGVREMMKTQPGILKLVLKDRVGVFRMALETGTPIVPVITYGENELFPSIDNPMLRGLNEWLYKTCGLNIPIPSFTSVVNWIRLADTPLSVIRSVAGRPIHVEQIDAPTADQIATLRDRYLRRLRGLYAKTAPPGLRLEVE